MLSDKLLDPGVGDALSLAIDLDLDSLGCVVVLIQSGDPLPFLHLLDVYRQASDPLNAVLDLLGKVKMFLCDGFLFDLIKYPKLRGDLRVHALAHVGSRLRWPLLLRGGGRY